MPSPPRPQEHVLGTTTETVGTPKLAVKKPTPGIETIDQREEATMRDDYVPRAAEEELQGPVESTGGIESDSPARESGYPPSYGEPPPLPQAPANCFPRDEIETRLLDHLDDLASIVLSGAVGIGKTMITLTILHHDRVKTKFGDSRYFMRCNNLASLESFLKRLSDAIGFLPAKSGEQLQPHLARRPPLLLVLDGVECILDPLAVESKEIATTIEEISQYRHICLIATSRMVVDIPSFQTVEMTVLSEGEARDAFYGLSPLDRSPVVDESQAWTSIPSPSFCSPMPYVRRVGTNQGCYTSGATTGPVCSN